MQPQITQLPDNIYIGHKETFSFLVHFVMKDLYFYWDYSVLSNTPNQYAATYKPYFYNEDFGELLRVYSQYSLPMREVTKKRFIDH